ncbi:Arc family DNA-binding protein [Mesorhizobium sp. BR1-1-12]|uniref:Arc family DNA-binding protein n=1 Tax=unclassified Mesorhizobium TaxID=325217 RepID=UPI001CCF02C3|nr:MULTISPECIES: Arc family DNA-binding protein [unclassified Mesorhizobium]MBZ9919117.1 Arc family DNA-binding protein [Mesorhizobium sp. BR1-1-7]MBZ9970104.1 Arc family DNA-binding protein [Mesorhizobium sp. BR1-1-12]
MQQQEDKFVIRFPSGMRDLIRENAETNRRTMNAEILHYIDQALTQQTKTTTSAN